MPLLDNIARAAEQLQVCFKKCSPLGHNVFVFEQLSCVKVNERRRNRQNEKLRKGIYLAYNILLNLLG